MNPISTAQQKTILEADIRLLERKRFELLEDIERIQKSKTKTIQFLREDTEKNEKKHTSLLGMVSNLTGQSNELDTSIKQIKLKEQEEANTIVSDAHKKAEEIVHDATIKMNSANAELERVQTMQKNLQDREDQLDTFSEDLIKQGKDIGKEKSRLKNEEEMLRRMTREVDEDLMKKRKEIEQLTPQIESASEALELLNNELAGRKGRLKEVTDTIEANERELLLKKAELQTWEDKLKEKETDLNGKEIWLNDREATVGRAYKEVISKGGTVNG
jgi:chromosome segregation ATPase